MGTNHHPTGHEISDAEVRPILWSGAALAIAAMLTATFVYGVFRFLAAHPTPKNTPSELIETDQQQFPPEPRVQEHPPEELEQLRVREQQILTTYGWVDKNNGVVRIPVDQARRIMLERGFTADKKAGK